MDDVLLAFDEEDVVDLVADIGERHGLLFLGTLGEHGESLLCFNEGRHSTLTVPGELLGGVYIDPDSRE